MKFHNTDLSAHQSGRKRVRMMRTKAIVASDRADLYDSLFIPASNEPSAALAANQRLA